jgi:rod shape determining protein RodA
MSQPWVIRSGGLPRSAAEPTGLLHRESRLRRSDWVLSAAVLSLCLIGVVLVAAATEPKLKLHPYSFVKKDVLNLVIGLALATAASMVDYRAIRALAPFLYGFGCLGLLATFVIGTSVNGSRSWIAIGGGFEVQPSEFAKIAIIVLVAMIFSERREGVDGPRDRDVLRALVLAGFPTLLTLVEPDLGNALVIGAITFGIFAVGGVPTRWMLGLVALLIIGSIGIVEGHVLHKYQEQRLTAFANPKSNLTTIGYNAYQARVAIGSGGLSGKGLFHGPQINSGVVFADYTDFVFATAGEETGFLGSALVIGLVGIVLWRGMRIAIRAPDMFGRVVAAGIVTWFAFEAFENIGMNLGIMPVTGIPLEFVSYGGSAMFANMLAVGLLQNVHIQTKAAGTAAGA